MNRKDLEERGCGIIDTILGFGMTDHCFGNQDTDEKCNNLELRHSDLLFTRVLNATGGLEMPISSLLQPAICTL
jgi:hypothetical protein